MEETINIDFPLPLDSLLNSALDTVAMSYTVIPTMFSFFPTEKKKSH